MLLLNVLKKNEELSKENESLKMWKISSVEKICALEEGKHICQDNLHQSREMMFEQLEENAILISLMKTMEMKSSMNASKRIYNFNKIKKNEELSKENESLKMWKISSVEKICALEEGEHICQDNLHQFREMMSE
ncbi:hypothetical protein Q3G72_008250 [Acer saccharum]|nr:hypothetical protein Q3G72_008250 [Acer saccharum]